MKKLGVVLLITGALVALLSIFSFHNVPFSVGGIVFAGIGLVIFLKG
jgi:hypothetical protein